MTNRLFSLLVLILGISFSGCEVEQLDVSYLYVPSFDLVLEPSQGEPTQEVREVRVVLGSESLGFYPVPGRIPFLASGEQFIRLEPVVRIAGVSDQRIVYPMYTVFEESVTLRLGQVDTIQPQISYIDEAIFLVVDDFDNSAGQFTVDLDDDPLTFLVSMQDDVDPSRRVATGLLTESNPVMEVATPPILPPNQMAREIWMEVEYRGDVTMQAALIPDVLEDRAVRASRYLNGALARDDWKKFYFQVGDLLSAQFVDEPFRASFVMAFNPAIGVEQQRFAIDNVRLIYR